MTPLFDHSKRNHMSTVAEILLKKGPHYYMIDGKTRLSSALAIMGADNHGYIVVTENDEYAGLFTDNDYFQKVMAMGKDPSFISLREVMSRNIPCADVNESTTNCLLLMSTYRTHYLPAFRQFEFVGVITMNDLLDNVITKKEKVTEEYERVF